MDREEVVAVTEALARLCHALRTPLGIALSVLNDQVQGLPCGDTDFEQAKAALIQVKDLTGRVAQMGHHTGECGPSVPHAINLVLDYFKRKGAECLVVRDGSIQVNSSEKLAPKGPCSLLEYAVSDYTVDAIALFTAAGIFAANGREAMLSPRGSSLRIDLLPAARTSTPSASSKLKRRSVLRNRGSSQHRLP